MPSTPVLVLIALTVLACAFIVALLLKIRSQHIAAQPVFGSYGGIDRASNPMWRNRVFDPAIHSGLAGDQAAGAFNRYAERELSEAMRNPQREANEPALGDVAEEQKRYVGDALPGFNGIGNKAK